MAHCFRLSMPRSVRNKKGSPRNTELQDILCKEWRQIPCHLSGCNIGFDSISNTRAFTSAHIHLCLNDQALNIKWQKSTVNAEKYDVLFKYHPNFIRFYSSLKAVRKHWREPLCCGFSFNHLNIWNMFSMKEQTKSNFIMTSFMQAEFSLH